MQQPTTTLILFFISLLLSIDCRSTHRGHSSKTLLVGQIYAPAGDPTRNLMGMILSINIFMNHTVLHNSLIPITTSTFPVNYAVDLNNHDFKVEGARGFHIVSMIWQPAYMYEDHVHLKENNIDMLNMTMRSIKYAILRGQIVKGNGNSNNSLPATQVKLELIESKAKGHVVDQIDFTCKSTTYPCPFEYWLNTARIKANVPYKLNATISNHMLPPRRKNHHQHQNYLASTISSQPAQFTIDPNVDTEINNIIITVANV